MSKLVSVENFATRQLLASESYCFGIFKPDAIARGIVPEIERSIGAAGLKIFNRLQTLLTPDDVQTIWPSIVTPHVSRTVPYMTSAPVEVFTVEGDEASERMLTIKRDFRRQYTDENPVISVMHTTDHDAELIRCVNHFYGENVNV